MGQVEEHNFVRCVGRPSGCHVGHCPCGLLTRVQNKPIPPVWRLAVIDSEELHLTGINRRVCHRRIVLVFPKDVLFFRLA